MQKISKKNIELSFIKKYLDKNKLTISAAESLTSGGIQKELGKLSGSSSFFEGGICAYSLTQKTNILNVDFKHAKEVNCVSEKVAKEMAKGVAELFKTNYSIATTGYAEKFTGVSKPFAFICIYDKNNNFIATKKIFFNKNNRIFNQKSCTSEAISMFFEYIKTKSNI